MKTVFYNELREKSNEIQKDTDNSAMINKVIDAYNRVVLFENTARKEGLLALEVAAETLDLQDNTQCFFDKMMTLVVDGTEPQMVKEIGMNLLISGCYHSYDGLICLMYYQASVMIQGGDHPFLVKQYMKSMLPDFIVKSINEREHEAELVNVGADKENWIKSLCEDKEEVDAQDFSIVNQTTLTVISLSDKEVQRVLREIDNQDLSVAMKGLPGKARARFFDNLSHRLGIMIAENVMYMGSVSMHDVEEACITIMKKVIRLEEKHEIEVHDFCAIKILISMYDATQKGNQELKDKYKDLKKLVDEIYRF